MKNGPQEMPPSEDIEKKLKIDEALDLRDLIVNTLPAIGDIKASDGYIYTTKNLQEIINNVRGNPDFIDHVTRTYGLRDKVQELLNKQETTKENVANPDISASQEPEGAVTEEIVETNENVENTESKENTNRIVKTDTKETTDAREAKIQEEIAKEYLKLQDSYEDINKTYQDELNHLNELRNEDIKNNEVTGLELDTRILSLKMDDIKERQKRYFDRLTDETKEKYLISQDQLANDYLTSYNEYTKSNEEYQQGLKQLDSMKEEKFLTNDTDSAEKVITEKEKELVLTSAKLDEIRSKYSKIFDRLTNETKEKYLTSSKDQQLLNDLIGGIEGDVKNIENSKEEKIDPSYIKEIGLKIKTAVENIINKHLSSEIIDSYGRVSYLLNNEDLSSEARFTELYKTLDSLKIDFENTKNNPKKKEMLNEILTLFKKEFDDKDEKRNDPAMMQNIAHKLSIGLSKIKDLYISNKLKNILGRSDYLINKANNIEDKNEVLTELKKIIGDTKNY